MWYISQQKINSPTSPARQRNRAVIRYTLRPCQQCDDPPLGEAWRNKGEGKSVSVAFAQAIAEIVEGGNFFSHVAGEENKDSRPGKFLRASEIR